MTVTKLGVAALNNRSCRSKHYMTCMQKTLKRQRFFFHQLQDFLGQSYSKQDAAMYIRFLKSHNKVNNSSLTSGFLTGSA